MESSPGLQMLWPPGVEWCCEGFAELPEVQKAGGAGVEWRWEGSTELPEVQKAGGAEVFPFANEENTQKLSKHRI